MNKLQRYDESITLCCKKCGAVFPATEKHRCFGPDEKSEEIFELKHFNEKLEIALVDKNTDVSALEAENERLLAEVIKLNMWINEVTYCIRKFCEYLRAGTQYQTEKDYRIAAKIEAILNREQEKQP